MTNFTVGTRVSYPDGADEGVVVAIIIPLEPGKPDRVRVKMPNGEFYEEKAEKLVRAGFAQGVVNA